MEKSKIDTRIMPLVYTLSEIPFIETVSSCGGHSPNYKAEVIFNVKDEERNYKNLEKLMKTVLNETCKDWGEVITHFNKRYYSMPHSDEIYHNWNISLNPHPAMEKGEPRRKAIEKEIWKITKITREYAHTLRKFYMF